MKNCITPENIDEILNEVIKKLDESEMILGCPGCSTDKVGEFRCEALNAIKKAQEKVKNVIHNTYLLK